MPSRPSRAALGLLLTPNKRAHRRIAACLVALTLAASGHRVGHATEMPSISELLDRYRIALTITANTWAQRTSPSCPVSAKTLFNKPSEAWAVEFIKNDLDTQFAIYICGMQSKHPPVMELGIVFASQGRVAADYLREKLARPLDDITTKDIVLVFNFMAVRRHYDVAMDVQLMRILEDRVGRMTDVDWRTFAQELLNDIRNPR